MDYVGHVHLQKANCQTLIKPAAGSTSFAFHFWYAWIESALKFAGLSVHRMSSDVITSFLKQAQPTQPRRHEGRPPQT